MKILTAADGPECSDVAVEEVAKRPWPADSAARIVSATETLPPEVQVFPPRYLEAIEAVATQAKCSVEIARRRHPDDDEE